VEQQTILALCAAGLVVCTGFLLMGEEKSSGETKRVRELTGKKTLGSNIREKLKVEDSGSRRKQIEETLGKIEERQKSKKKKAKSIESRLMQADWSMKPQSFMMVSVILAVVFGAVPFVLGLPLKVCGALAFVMGFGFPRFILNSAINRRQKKFTAHFADAMDIIVRGVRTGLPLGDCLKIIAHESPDPLGSEFRRVVEGESLGIPIDVCLDQMYERMPGRKILREKIKALSAEAKVSAMIIGALPIIVMLLVTIASPDYMNDLYKTTTGQRNMMIGAAMMVMGTLMMRKMINFKF